MRGKINSLGRNTAVRDHRSMKLGDGPATGFDQQEGEDGVDKARAGPQQHLAAEPGGPQQMPPIGFPNRGRVFVEETLNIHAHRLDPKPRYRVAKMSSSLRT
jgi:hypothetical protein